MQSNTEMEANRIAFINRVTDALKEGNIAEAGSLFADNDNHRFIENSSWDLLPLLSKYFSDNTKVDYPALFDCCEKLIDILVDKANPEECILQMIEEVEDAKGDTIFITLLKPLQKVLSRITTKRQNSLAWCLNAISAYIGKLHIPDVEDFEGDEKMLIDSDPVVDRITTLYVNVLLFYDVLLHDLDKIESDFLEERKMIFGKFLIGLLGKPLAYLNMECNSETKSKTRCIVESLCKNILTVIEDPISLAEIENENIACMPSPFSQAILFYLIFGEKLFIEKIPKIYSHVYVFQTYLHLIPILCNEDPQFLINKTLKLAEALIETVKKCELNYQLLDSKNHKKFVETISKIIIYNPLESNRRRALFVLKQYIDNFEARGKYLLIYNITITIQNVSLISYIITYYKERLHEALNTKNESIMVYFTGQKMYNLLQVFCYLPKGEESNFLELSDEIIAVLNLLRYIVIRDKNNLTKIWDFIPKLDRIFLQPLRNGLTSNKADLEQKLNIVLEDVNRGKTEPTPNDKVSVRVGNEILPDMPPAERLKALRSALVAIDVIAVLLTRLQSFIEERNNK